MSDQRTIYIVDDDVAVRDSLEAMLLVQGFVTATFESAEAFLDAATPALDGCVLLDVRMPGMSGLELQKRLKQDGIGIPVILMTGHGDIKMSVEAMREGAADFIEKPCSNETIMASIESALQRAAGSQRSDALVDEIKLRIDRLTVREREVLEQLVVGNANKVIAYELDISPRTVEVHRARVMEKLQARNLSHLVRIAIAGGVDPEIS